MVACWMYPEKSFAKLKKICPEPKRLNWSVCFHCGYHGKPIIIGEPLTEPKKS